MLAVGRIMACVPAVAVALTLGACSSEPDDPAASGAERRISQARFIAQADAICQGGQAQLAVRLSKLPPARARANQITAIAGSLDVHARAIRTEVSKLRALDRPSPGRQALEAYLDQRLTGANALSVSADAARAGDVPALEASLGQFGSRRIGVLARRFGFKVCGGRYATRPPAVPGGAGTAQPGV